MALMKGHTWEKHAHKMDYPCMVQAKIDGVRCEITVEDDGSVTYMSYAGKPLYNLGRHDHYVKQLCKDFNVRKLDVEVMAEGSFTKTIQLTRSSKTAPDYDSVLYLLDVPEWTGDWQERFTKILCNGYLPVPQFRIANSPEEVEKWYEVFREEGFEGAMVKSYKDVYRAGKRTYGWLKLKPVDTCDGKVVGLLEAVSEDGVPLGRAGSLVVLTEDGRKVNVPGMAHSLATAFWKAPSAIIGQWIEFQFMEEASAGGFRHPRFIRVREAKE